MIASKITYRDLDDFLRQLGFLEFNADLRWRAYHHPASDTLIVLGCHDHGSPARDSDLVSVRRHLVDNELVDQVEFDEFLARGE
jgi:hypothetical protein